MENGIRGIFLAATFLVWTCTFVGVSFAETDQQRSTRNLSPLIEPNILRLDLIESDIDTEDFEFGLFWGKISVEDFGTNDLIAITAGYHVSEDIFVEAGFGDASLQTPIEQKFIGGAKLAGDLSYSYYNLSLGYHLFPGQVFVWDEWTFNSQIFLLGGVGITDYFSEKDTSFNFGVGYRLVILDWLTLRVDFIDHIFSRDTLEQLGETSEKTVNNLEMRFGASIYF